jgi:RNA polymerase sigma-70 factor (ECF subfamily)
MSTVDQDNWLVRLKSDGDVRDQALEELRTILVRGLTATCRNRYGSKVQTEDVVQEALIKIMDKLDTFEGRSKFTTWAMTITVRLAISGMRRKHFQDISINDLVGEGMRFEPASRNVDRTGDNEVKSNLLATLNDLIKSSLTEKQRDAIHALLHGMPVEVFAEKTGSNRNAVYKLIHDARSKLRQGFEKAGYKAEDVNAVFA